MIEIEAAQKQLNELHNIKRETLPSSIIKQKMAEDSSVNKRIIKITRREKAPDSFEGTSCEWSDYKIEFELSAQIND